ncbi:zinc fingers and homeoboxes protein 2-like [Eucyclogobius newberryi]|uniref:zinc fingers and homeoboxes protein 2-like n=1 Tax=Eucyclogobius newberryi TaxID=166745 RepID=UPI003B58FD32
MASRRKASTPCMIRPDHTIVEPDDDETDDPCDLQANINNHTDATPMETDVLPEKERSMDLNLLDKASDSQLSTNHTPESNLTKTQKKQQGGYECKYCPFSTHNLNTFKEHVDANHPNVILNPLYLCAVCNFNTKKFDTLTEHNERCHPGESNFKFKRIKMNNQTILEQTIEGCSNNAIIYNSSSSVSGKVEEHSAFPMNKSTAVKISKPKIMSLDSKWTDGALGKLAPELVKKPITAVNVNGTVIIPESTLLKADCLAHIMPSLQRPLNYTQVPKIAVPLNTTKYNPSLDDNLTLISSFNKFPYPTQAELSWLTAASKHPEEQIKVWFTTQRLKQGISWSPEEVEEARKKMFNGTISHTFAVVAPQLNSQTSSSSSTHTSASKSTTTSLLQPLPCQLVGQTSLVLTSVANGSVVTCAPLALTVANQVAQSLKRPLASPVISTESKRPSIIQTISAPVLSPKLSSPKVLSFTLDPNKTSEQLSVLRASFTQCPFPEEDEIYRLIENTGLSRGEIKKWFSEQRLLNLKGVPPPPVLVKAEVNTPSKDGAVKKTVLSQFPLLERVKGKSSEQLKALEENFQKRSCPTEAELDQLAQDTRLSKTEVDCWFSERRALEKALLSMKSADDRPGAMQNGAAHREQGGKHHLSSPHPPVLSYSSASPPVLAVSSPHPPTLSSSASPPILTSSSSSSPHPPVLSASNSPAPITSRSLTLLREMFCRTQWPSPDEYSQLEVQTSLGRTDIVRWFKDHRSALKHGETLEWMQDQLNANKDKPPFISVETLTAKEGNPGENTTELDHGVTDRRQTRPDKNGDNVADSGKDGSFCSDDHKKT